MIFLIKHKVFIILIIISVIPLLFIAINILKPTFSNLNKTSAIIPEVQVVTNQESTKAYKLDIKYPQLIDKQNDSLAANSINADIKKIVDDEVTDFKLGWKEYDSNTGKYVYPSANISKEDRVQNTFSLSYEIANLTDNIYSLEIHTSKWYREGNAPNNQIFIYNYDFKNHKVISFTDLFTDSELIDRLSAITLNKLKDKYRGVEGEFDNGLKDLQLRNNTKFLLKKDGIEILFSQYEIGDRPTGEPRVIIPYREIRDLLSPDYIFLSKH